MMPTAIVAYLALFATVGFLFVLASLLLGKFLRAHRPTAQKLETYECGEPAVGPGVVQFDLRFYVVALLFLIFEVEVAFFFPPATVFGKANQLRRPDVPKVGVVHAHAPTGSEANGSFLTLSPSVEETYRELGVANPTLPRNAPGARSAAADAEAIKGNAKVIENEANTLALASMLDLGVFFAVLLVGFAYIWRRGDLDWVRATRYSIAEAETPASPRRYRVLQP
jgi:NADH-quinone oxidoreductase subunit A